MSISLKILCNLLVDQYLSKFPDPINQRIKEEGLFQDYAYLCGLSDRKLIQPKNSVFDLIENKKHLSVNNNFLYFTDWTLISDPTFSDIIGSTGWKAHISILPEDLNRAWKVIYPVLENRALMFKVVNLNTTFEAEDIERTLYFQSPRFQAQRDQIVIAGREYLSRVRLTNGMQVTVCIETGKEWESINYLQEIDRRLISAGIRPGIIHKSDRKLSSFVSVRYAGSMSKGYSSADLFHPDANDYKPLDVPDPFLAWEEASVDDAAAAASQPLMSHEANEYLLTDEQVRVIQSHQVPFDCGKAAIMLSRIKLPLHEWTTAIDKAIRCRDPVAYVAILSILYKHDPAYALSLDPSVVQNEWLLRSLAILDGKGVLTKASVPQLVNALTDQSKIDRCDSVLYKFAIRDSLSATEWLNYVPIIVNSSNPSDYLAVFLNNKEEYLSWPDSPTDFHLILNHKQPQKCADTLKLLYKENPLLVANYRDKISIQTDLDSFTKLLLLCKTNKLLLKFVSESDLAIMLEPENCSAYLKLLSRIFISDLDESTASHYYKLFVAYNHPQTSVDILSILDKSREKLLTMLPNIERFLQTPDPVSCTRAFVRLHDFDSFPELHSVFFEKMLMQQKPSNYVYQLPIASDLSKVFTDPVFLNKEEGSLYQKLVGHHSFGLCVNALAILPQPLFLLENIEKIMSCSDANLQLLKEVIPMIDWRNLIKKPEDFQCYFDKIIEKLICYKNILPLLTLPKTPKNRLEMILNSNPDKRLAEALSELYVNREHFGGLSKLKERIPNILSNDNPCKQVFNMIEKAKLGGNSPSLFLGNKSEKHPEAASAAAAAVCEPSLPIEGVDSDTQPKI